MSIGKLGRLPSVGIDGSMARTDSLIVESRGTQISSSKSLSPPGLSSVQLIPALDSTRGKVWLV